MSSVLHRVQHRPTRRRVCSRGSAHPVLADTSSQFHGRGHYSQSKASCKPAARFPPRPLLRQTRANPCAEVTSPVCRLPLLTLFECPRDCSSWIPVAELVRFGRWSYDSSKYTKGLKCPCRRQPGTEVAPAFRSARTTPSLGKPLPGPLLSACRCTPADVKEKSELSCDST